MNPYNPTKPGNLFVGYEELRQEILNGFRDGNSFAILGGRRCGKTSFLIQMEKDLDKDGLAPFKPIPCRFSHQEFGNLSCDLLFEKMYNLVMQNVQAASWVQSEPDKEYQNFLTHLDKEAPLLIEKHGPDWVAILLVDELDFALSFFTDDLFFQNLRNLLMESRFSRHFRMIATGVKDMSHLISSGSSPLNNLRHKYLGILRGKNAQELVGFGFNDAGFWSLDSSKLRNIFYLYLSSIQHLAASIAKLLPVKLACNLVGLRRSFARRIYCQIRIMICTGLPP